MLYYKPVFRVAFLTSFQTWVFSKLSTLKQSNILSISPVHKYRELYSTDFQLKCLLDCDIYTVCCQKNIEILYNTIKRLLSKSENVPTIFPVLFSGILAFDK